MPDPLPVGHDVAADPATVGEATTADGVAPAAGSAPTAAATGRFTILGRHAEGGLGRVHLARDEQLRRTVALKEIRPERADDARIRQRFQAEAEITGQLEHPGIVPIYALEHDAAGRPVYAMRFIQGRTLGEAIKTYHRLPTALGLRELLQRFIAICQTLAYAHSKGVIHRDLKPANVMLGDYGETLVVDWGLAKKLSSRVTTTDFTSSSSLGGVMEGQTIEHAPAAEDSHQLTTAGMVLGTPAYMAPEQARGEVDIGPAADIYALGAILYEILTGRAPYQGRSSEEILRRVLTDGPPPPLTLQPRLPRALNAICLHAMARVADSRYALAGELAKDVERWLADDPVTAYREPWQARAGRWVRRHRTLATALGVAALLLLLAGGVALYWQGQELAKEQARLERNADALVALADTCEAALRAEDADKAKAALAEIDRRLPDGGAADLHDRLERARADLAMLIGLQQFFELHSNSPQQTEEQAAVRLNAFREFGIVPGETAVAAAALRIKESSIRDLILFTLDHWLAVEPRPEVVALAQAVDPDEFRNAMRTHRAERRFDRLHNLIMQPEALRQPPRCAILVSWHGSSPERRLAILKDAVQRQPGDFQLLMTLANNLPVGKAGAAERARYFQAALAVRPSSAAAWNNLATTHIELGEWEPAGGCLAQGVRLNPKSAPIHTNIALVHNGQGNVALGRAAFEEALRCQPDYLPALRGLANAHLRAGEHQASLALYRKAEAINARNWETHASIGYLLGEMGDVPGALAAYRQAIQLEPNDATNHYGLAFQLAKAGETDAAIAAYREAIRIDPVHAKAHSNLGLLLKAKGDLPGAIAEYREAIRHDPANYRAWFNLGDALKISGNFAEAETACRESIRLEPKSEAAHHTLASVLSAAGDLKGAIAEYEIAARLDPKYYGVFLDLGLAHQAANNPRAAAEAYRTAARLAPTNAQVHNNLGVALLDLGELDQALACFTEALRLKPDHAHAKKNLAVVRQKLADRAKP